MKIKISGKWDRKDLIREYDACVLAIKKTPKYLKNEYSAWSVWLDIDEISFWMAAILFKLAMEEK